MAPRKLSNVAQVQEGLLKEFLNVTLLIREDNKIKVCVKDYCKSENREQDRYALFVSLENTILSQFEQIASFKQALANNRIPGVLNGFDYAYSAEKITNELMITAEGTKSTPRILRMLLGTVVLPIESLEPDLFVTAWVQCYRCHYLLWEQGIQHGDISMDDLMWNPESQRGILNDFDLATPGRAGSSCAYRTGSIPFVALALLSEECPEGRNIQEYHHDLESFIWALVWAALLDNEDQQSFLQSWNTPNVELSIRKKMALLYAVKFPKYKTYKGGNRWTLAVSLLRYLISLQDKTMGEDCVKFPPEVIFTEFEEQVKSAWKWENFPFKPMVNGL